MASWFALLERIETGVFGISSAFDEETGLEVPVTAATKVYPCLATMSMGFTWALHFCQRATETLVEKGLGVSGRAATEKRPAPIVSWVSPVTSSYVDNAGVFSLRSSQADFAKVENAFGLARLRVHDVVRDSADLSHLGAHLDGKRGLLLHHDRRVWRVYQAGRAILCMRRLRGEVL